MKNFKGKLKRAGALILSAILITAVLISACYSSFVSAANAQENVKSSLKPMGRLVIVVKEKIYAYDDIAVNGESTELHQAELYEMSDILESEDGTFWYEIIYKDTKKYVPSTDVEWLSRYAKRIEALEESTTEVAEETPTEVETEVAETQIVEIKSKVPKEKCLGNFKVTFYTGGTKTATGAVPKVGRTIAVDPKVIPYGSKVRVDGFGTFIAEDTGGAIKGNKVDIYLSTRAECLDSAHGVKYCDVYIIED